MTDVDICNMALSFLGDAANVTSIDPPEGSSQADHCARFLPIAKRELLSAFPWTFALRSEPLVEYAKVDDFDYHDFAFPADCLRFVSITREPYHAGIKDEDKIEFVALRRDNSRVIRTSEKKVYALYISDKVSVDDYPGAFCQALAWLLASKLSGALQGGQGGQKSTTNCLAQSRIALEQAKLEDANQVRDDSVVFCNLSGDFLGAGV